MHATLKVEKVGIQEAEGKAEAKTQRCEEVPYFRSRALPNLAFELDLPHSLQKGSVSPALGKGPTLLVVPGVALFV